MNDNSKFKLGLFVIFSTVIFFAALFILGMMDRFITDALKEGYTFLPITSETRTCHHGINN